MVEMPADHDDESSEPNWLLMIVGYCLKEYERAHPGSIERIAADAEDADSLTQIIRLRGPRLAPEIRREHGKAVRWLGVQAALYGRRKRRR